MYNSLPMDSINMDFAGHLLQQGSMDRPHSPSARFYASRSTTPSAPEAREAETPQAETILPFGHWAVSYPDHSYTSHCDLPHDEAQVSPRTVIPERVNNPPYASISPEDRVRELREDSEDDDTQMITHLPFRWRGSTLAATPGLHMASPAAAWPDQRETYVPPSQLVLPSAQSQSHNSPSAMSAAFQGPSAYGVPPSSGSAYGSTYISDLEDGEIQEDPLMHPDTMDQDGASLVSSPLGSAQSDSVASSILSTTHPAVLLHAIHDACLEATQRYLNSHRKNWHLRTRSPYGSGAVRRTKRAKASGFSPYLRSSSPRTPEQHRNRESPSPDLDWEAPAMHGSSSRNKVAYIAASSTDEVVPRPTESILANTAAICSLLWRRAQATRLLALRAERAALDDMHKLTVWAEVVVVTSVPASSSSFSSSSASSSPPMVPVWEAGPDPALLVARIIAAGRALCTWLGDDAAVRKIDEALPFPWIDVDLNLDWLEDTP